MLVNDPCLTREIIMKFGNAAGVIIGVGSLRVGNGGMWSQFSFTSVEEVPLEF